MLYYFLFQFTVIVPIRILLFISSLQTTSDSITILLFPEIQSIILSTYPDNSFSSINEFAEYYETDGGNDLKRISELVHEDHLLIVVSARRGSISFRPSLDHIFTQIQRNYTGRSILLIYPNGYSIDSDMTEMPPLMM